MRGYAMVEVVGDGAEWVKYKDHKAAVEACEAALAVDRLEARATIGRLQAELAGERAAYKAARTAHDKMLDDREVLRAELKRRNEQLDAIKAGWSRAHDGWPRAGNGGAATHHCPSWRGRILEERDQLVARIDTLTAFMTGPGFSAIREDQRRLLRVQSSALHTYLHVLKARIEAFRMQKTAD